MSSQVNPNDYPETQEFGGPDIISPERAAEYGLTLRGNPIMDSFTSELELSIARQEAFRNVDWRKPADAKITSKTARRATLSQQMGQYFGKSCLNCAKSNGPFQLCTITVLDDGKVLFDGSCNNCGYCNATRRSFRKFPPEEFIQYMQKNFPESAYVIGRDIEHRKAEEPETVGSGQIEPIATRSKRSKSSAIVTAEAVAPKSPVNDPGFLRRPTSTPSPSSDQKRRVPVKLSPFSRVSLTPSSPKVSSKVPPIEAFVTAKARKGYISSPKQISPVIQTTKSWYQSPLLDKTMQSRMKVQDFAALKNLLDDLKKDEEQIGRDITVLTHILVTNGIIPDLDAMEEDSADTESGENPFDAWMKPLQTVKDVSKKLEHNLETESFPNRPIPFLFRLERESGGGSHDLFPKTPRSLRHTSAHQFATEDLLQDCTRTDEEVIHPETVSKGNDEEDEVHLDTPSKESSKKPSPFASSVKLGRGCRRQGGK